MCRVASWLECERWYVETVFLEGGVGGLLGVVEQLDVVASAPGTLSVFWAPPRVGFFICV
jgi:hypothetical protein